MGELLLVQEIRRTMGNLGDLDHMEDKKPVIDFFSRDDISRQGPDKRDVVKIK